MTRLVTGSFFAFIPDFLSAPPGSATTVKRPAEYSTYRDALRTELGRSGWVNCETPAAIACRHAGRGCTRIAERHGLSLFLLDLSPEARFPDFRARSELYRRCATEAGESAVIVLGDAAGAVRVWMWRGRTGPFAGLYREAMEQPGAAWIIDTAARAAEEMTGAGRDGEDPRGAVVAALQRLLSRSDRRRRGLSPAEASGGCLDVQERIACANSATDTLAVWRALRSVRLLDPDCADGDWLLQGAEVLERFHAACLQRMVGWLTDSSLMTPRHSAALEEMRRLVSMAGGESLCGAVPHVRLLIHLQNVYGASVKALDVATTRLRFAQRLTSEAPAMRAAVMPLLAHRVVRLSTTVPVRAYRITTEGNTSSAAHAALVERAFGIVGELQLAGGSAPDAVGRAYRDLKRRRLRLIGSAQQRASEPPLEELGIHFPALATRPGHLIIR
jgi:hypothetical protein